MTEPGLSEICQSDPQLLQYLQFGSELADLAATITLDSFRRPLAVENKQSYGQVHNSFDPVTQADRRTEMALRGLIEQRYPLHGVRGEEYDNRVARDEHEWVIDPIDGTRAYITGLPLWGTLIALHAGAEPLIGVMDQPYLQERYFGGPTGAICYDRQATMRLQVSECAELANAIMMTTDPTMFTSEEAQTHAKLAKQVRMLRYGGDCYAYCMLARGHVDLVVEAGLQAYDIQALIPIVVGAGGIVTNWQGGSAATGGQVIAAAGASLHEAALSMLRG